tara:strand:+ start:492 stop:1283 length:792 start_codon:yes stop_codon:yes gene_type:complete
MLRESFSGKDSVSWVKNRFDVIHINKRGDREVVFNASLTASEKELAATLNVRQTPSIIFLDGQNQVVMRSDGYRTTKDMQRIFKYVDSKSYLKESLSDFIARTAVCGGHYKLRSHPQFSTHTDLSAVSTPLMVIFEDAYCDGCDLMHDTLLQDETVNKLMSRMTVVRLDTRSQNVITTPDGQQLLPGTWTDKLRLSARPAIVIFTNEVERIRIAGVLRRFHFQTALRYVAEAGYQHYATPRDFGRAYREQLLREGKTVDVGVQ